MRVYFLSVILSLVFLNNVYAAQVSLSTYYPSPVGVYDRLKLQPRDELDGNCDLGNLYVDDDAGLLHFCGHHSSGNSGRWSAFAFEEDLQAVKGEVKGLKSDFESFEASTESKISSLNNQVSELSKDVRKIKDDTAHLTNTLDKLKEDHEERIKTLEEQVRTLTEQMQTVQAQLSHQK